LADDKVQSISASNLYKESISDEPIPTPSQLEENDFVINDVHLRIAPEQIVVQKQSSNLEWKTLRTRSSQKVKSGFSTARVSFSIIFKTSNYEDQENLINLVAGLRSTPFCVVYNKFLDSTLGRPEHPRPLVKEDIEYSDFKPIMLAMASMSFSTLGHENKPDCIQGMFDFIWFNYLPYTDTIAFKTNVNFSIPGLPSESPIWKAFYAPFKKKSVKVKFPHQENDKASRTTQFIWREYLLLSKTNPKVSELSSKLADAIKKDPFKASVTLNSLIHQATGTVGDAKPEYLTAGIYDTLARELVKNGSMNLSADLKSYLDTMSAGTLTSAVQDVMTPFFKRTNSKNKINLNSEADQMAATLADRLKQHRELERQYQDAKNKESYVKVIDLNVNFAKMNSPQFIGGLELYSKNKYLDISHISSQNNPAGAIIKQVVVTFENILSTIPMLGYRYPTLQHIGSIDARIQIIIDARSSENSNYVHKINYMFDDIESAAIKFRQVPAGLTNLIIKNDFLGLFGLDEFLTEDISTQTIEGFPGRSLISLSLVEAGITSAARLEDSEEIKQEHIVSNTDMLKEIWKVIKKNTIKWEGFDQLDRTAATLTKEDLKYHFLKANVSGEKSNIAFKNLVQEACNIYNGFISKVWSYCIVGQTSGRWISQQIERNTTKAITHRLSDSYGEENIDRTSYFTALSDLTEDGGALLSSRALLKQYNTQNKNYEVDAFSDIGIVPGIDLVQKSIIDMGKKSLTRDKKTPQELLTEIKNLSTAVSLNKEQYANKLKVKYRELESREIKLKDMGLNEYLQDMRVLLDKITQQYSSLEQFKFIQKIQEKEGLGKGLFAYPDFREQITSVAAYTEGKTSFTDLDLMKYNPDCYFWYPTYDGSNSNTALNSLIDPIYIAAARKHSTDLFNSAQGSTEDFFQSTYKALLKNSTNQIPFEQLEKKEIPKEKKQTYYQNDPSHENSLFSGKITMDVTVDPTIKSSVNTYQEKNMLMSSVTSCSHSSDLNILWGGVSTGIPNQESIQSSQQSSPNYFTSQSGTSQQQSMAPVQAPVNTKKSKSSGSMVTRAKNLAPLIVKMAAEAKIKVDPSIVMGIIEHESGFTPTAEYKKPGQKVAHIRNAKGLMQIVPGSHGIADQDVYKLLDPAFNLQIGIKFIGVLFNKYKNYEKALSAYHMGSGDYDRLMNAIKKRKENPNYKFSDEAKVNKYTGKKGKSELQIVNLPKTGGLELSPSGNISLRDWNGYVREVLEWSNKWAKYLKEWGFTSGNVIAKYVPTKEENDQIRNNLVNTSSTDVATTIASPLTEAIKEFQLEQIRGQGQGLLRAYPAFKLYFVEEDSDEHRYAFDDFFSYSSVQSIRVVSSKHIAADLCEIYLTNVNGILSNRRFKHESDGGAVERDINGKIILEKGGMNADTKYENPIASILLKEGTNIHLKLGYGSDPDDLEKTFNGHITQIEFSENDDLILIVAQSYGTELVQNVQGIEKPVLYDSSALFGWNFWGFSREGTTGHILEQMIAQPEVLHFGRWNPHTNRGVNTVRDLLTNRWTFTPQPADDNIFAPETGREIWRLGKGLVITDMRYIVYRTTIWDIFQEMTLRNPNYIAMPVPYSDIGQERMTMFYGLPNQLYFSRTPTFKEKDLQNILNSVQIDAMTNIGVSTGIYGSGLSNVGNSDKEKSAANMGRLKTNIDIMKKLNLSNVNMQLLSNLEKDINTNNPNAIILSNQTLLKIKLNEGKAAGYIRPFRKYHLITSAKHIMINNIKANTKDIANTVVIEYPSLGLSMGLSTPDKDPNMDEQFSLKLDSAIPSEDMKTQVCQFVNVFNDELAQRYATGMLLRNVKESYSGNLIIIGNPSIRCHDIVFVHDEYTDMSGPIEVEEVQHIFDQQYGFRTEIKPNLFACANEWSLLTSAEAMGVVMEAVLSGSVGRIGNGGDTVQERLSFMPWLLGRTVNFVGGFMSQKVLNYTQLGQPIVSSPLLYHGRTFTGGLPVHKMPTSVWETIFSEWHPSIDVGYSDFFEDTKHDFTTWIKNMCLGNSVGKLSNFSGGDHNK